METKENIFTEEELEQKINFQQNEIIDFCKKHGAEEISFFLLRLYWLDILRDYPVFIYNFLC